MQGLSVDVVTGDLCGQVAEGIAQKAQGQGDGIDRQRKAAAKPAANEHILRASIMLPSLTARRSAGPESN